MRRSTAVLILILSTVGVTWQVASAASPSIDTLVVCSRPGADLRAPDTQGRATCEIYGVDSYTAEATEMFVRLIAVPVTTVVVQ